MMKSSGMLSVT